MTFTHVVKFTYSGSTTRFLKENRICIQYDWVLDPIFGGLFFSQSLFKGENISPSDPVFFES